MKKTWVNPEMINLDANLTAFFDNLTVFSPQVAPGVPGFWLNTSGLVGHPRDDFNYGG